MPKIKWNLTNNNKFNKTTTKSGRLLLVPDEMADKHTHSSFLLIQPWETSETGGSADSGNYPGTNSTEIKVRSKAVLTEGGDGVGGDLTQD